MRILVTGGRGFIGSHVTDAYVREGHDVVIVDNLSTGTELNKNEKARLYRIDMRNDSLEEVFKQERPDVVNHHAAQISVPLSVREPLDDADVSIKGTPHLLELSQRYGVKKFIFASTGGAIYGEAGVVAIFAEALLQGKLPTLNRFVNQPLGMIRDYCYVKDGQRRAWSQR